MIYSRAIAVCRSADPLNSAGQFEGDSADSPFTISGSYLDSAYYADDFARDGLELTIVSAHRPLQAYTDGSLRRLPPHRALREPATLEHAITQPRQRRWSGCRSSCI